MRVLSSSLLLAVLLSGNSLAVAANGSQEAQLVESINAYRSALQHCDSEASEELAPLSPDPRLVLQATGAGDLQGSLARAGYPMVNVQAISLSGPRDAQAAMQALQESFCRVLLDPQYADIGISREGRDWRIVVARPLLGGHLKDWQAEGQMLLDEINRARGQARQCGGKPFASAKPLAWNATLASVAETHSRAMANGNFFSPLDKDGRTPGDRAELAGYSGTQVGQNIAAAVDRPSRVVEGWLASPGHCTNVMNPRSSELGAAYAVDPQSDAGIYWVGLFGEP
ncbi:CAP domain-containing protein [Pseudomonas stutzeri]|uniref:CAP domain-containing protein n=1 Tax=Stutzerimonas stutzeri TaxID=316 RepID=UPI002108B752|nr:CAP domain-containing protein [Stutzerimonas stutzeri]MCQ4312848.1 CAP domain-containing protein [Stutzerimonas stutzeri]